MITEYVTDADLRAWNPFGSNRDYEPDFPLSITERRKRYKFGLKKEMKARVVAEKPPKPPREPKPLKIKPESAAAKTYYQKSVNNALATNQALELVQKLGYDLSAISTHEERVKRIEGWHIFCQAVGVLYPMHSVRGISDALTIRNAPSRDTLSCMFLNCRESPYKTDQIKSMLGLEK